MLFTKLTLCSQMRNIVLNVAMNLVFIYLGEECLVIIYSVSELAMGKVPVCFEPDYGRIDIGISFIAYNMNNQTNQIIRQLSKHIFLKLKNSLPNLQKRCNTCNSTIYFLVYIVHNQHQMIHNSNTFLLWGSILDNDILV